MIRVFDVKSDHFSIGHIHCPTQATPTHCTSVYHCHVCLDFRRVLPICRKSGHVGATLTNELQHMLLWMVRRRIGSAIIRSRKNINRLHTCVLLETIFLPFMGNSCSDDRPPTEKPVEGNDPGKVRTVAPANQQPS